MTPNQASRESQNTKYGNPRLESASMTVGISRWIEVGASPRASLALDKCGRVHAWLNSREYVDPADVRAIAHDVLRHRLILSYEAHGEGVGAEAVIDEIIKQVALP